jgi:hypothetical protein
MLIFQNKILASNLPTLEVFREYKIPPANLPNFFALAIPGNSKPNFNIGKIAKNKFLKILLESGD